MNSSLKLPPRLSLARLPTPIHLLKNTSKSLGKEIYAWRDDLTGFIDSGNKLRKLEFFVADAMSKGCDWLITCGGPQSNHTRATTAVARQFGLGVSILILPRPGFDRTKPANSNLLLNQIFDAKITWIEPEEFVKAGSAYDLFFEREIAAVTKLGKKPYVIPLGGSNPLGCFGYIAGIPEMLSTWKQIAGNPAPDSIFCALGSGGTFMGLKLGIEDQKLPTQLYGVNVIGPIETANQYLRKLTTSLAEHGIHTKVDPASVIDGYVGGGYSIASNADLSFYRDLARSEGIVLDPCYTGKAFQGMLAEIKKDPERFGKKILFLHSGGAFGNFAYAEQYNQALQG